MAAPELTPRRSERIRKQELVKVQESSVNKPAATVNPNRPTRQARKRHGKPQESDSGRIDCSPIRGVGTPRNRDSATYTNLSEQNRTMTTRTPHTTRQTVEETGTPRVSQGAPDEDPQKLQRYSRLDSWLEKVRTSPAADADPFFLDWRTLRSSDTARSTSPSTESATSDQRPSVEPDKENAGKKEIKNISLAEGLRTRLVEFEERVGDLMTASLKSAIAFNAGSILLEQTEPLCDKIELFLKKANEFQRGASIRDAVEELSDAINEWKSTVHMATVTNQDFNKDLEHCKYHANAAIFQRTVMMSILNRHQISDKFTFNCEGQWLPQRNHYALPSTEENSIPDPKPDLAIFFRFESLLGEGPYSYSTPIPDRLKACMSPDGSIDRCFPFIFVEAKKGFHDLEFALMANMHSASQALFNIYVWMSEAGHQDKFFSDVRLFSLAINAKKFAFRVHRAQAVEEGGGEGLEFYYDDICDGYNYKRDHVCNLIRNVIDSYAETTLLDVLKKSVLVVTQNQRQALKRKSEVAGLTTYGPLSKKTAVATSN
ncbi:hypothetical protein F5Y10DRAFT_289243 [Nemania abortiva]|nr:hypothetical protein F5Y10DRAFT_289243 [Nemania abortiva]